MMLMLHAYETAMLCLTNFITSRACSQLTSHVSTPTPTNTGRFRSSQPFCSPQSVAEQEPGPWIAGPDTHSKRFPREFGWHDSTLGWATEG